MTPLFCSTIIPTIGRPSLNRAVESVLSAIGSTDDCELIVGNDSGHPLPPAAWQQSDKAQIIATNRHNRSVARNCGAAVANIRSGDQSSTTDYANMINQNRQSREKLLAAPGTLVRLRQSAATKERAYWHGRIVYYYLASSRWNLRRRHLFTAIGRALHAFAAAALTGPHLLSRPFWRALTTPHHNQVRQLIEQRV